MSREEERGHRPMPMQWNPPDERTEIWSHARDVERDPRWLLSRTRPHTPEREALDSILSAFPGIVRTLQAERSGQDR